MRLSTKGRYGTRAMLDLAVHQTDGPVNIAEIAKREDISARYLEQLMIKLASRELVRPVRGRGGGFVLGRTPAEITLGEIIEALEGPVNVTDCTRDPSVCDRSTLCTTREIWEELSQTITSHLDQITLEDMAQRHRKKHESEMGMYHI